MISWPIIPAALVLDAALGDPRRLPHPTRAMGWFAGRVEAPLRRALRPLVAGALGWVLVVGAAAAFAVVLPPLAGAAACAACATFGAASAAARAGKVASFVASVWLVYVSIAPRDLAVHALRVSRALREGGETGLGKGRSAVSMIVGRDVGRLDEAGVVRAAVESVAESAVDGVCAPLFWALALGPVGAFAYRAANTLDSMWGHRSERYLLYGRVAARADDALNWIPARLAFACSVAAAFVLGLGASRHFSGAGALRLGWRDRRKHESPNAAWLEASFAGALGLRLGGDAWYGGERLAKPYLGEARRGSEVADIRRAVALMYATAAIFALVGTVAVAAIGVAR
jgi:adenosylcobinamide-phosphate synthase